MAQGKGTAVTGYNGRVKQYLLEVAAEKLDDGRYLAIATNLPGTHAEGDTIAEAMENLEDVARITIEMCVEKDLPLPTEFEGTPETPLIKAELLVQVEA
jgi:predicted RNase H-like HicB family nuclease